MRLLKGLTPAIMLAASGFVAAPAPAQEPPPQADALRVAYARFAPTAEAAYLKIGDTSYETLIYRPSGWQASDRRPAIVLFFGGAWRQGSPWQFAPLAAHFQQQGYVVFLPDYRVSTRDNSTLVDSTRDARSALRWVKAHAAEQGVDPARVIAGGGSAGGHLAAAAPVVRLDNAGEDLAIDPAPAALLLFNPAANLVALGEGDTSAAARFGVTMDELKSVDPITHVRAGYPPCIVFHGTADRLVPFASIEAFVAKVKASGGRCDLVPFEGRDHGFFNLNRGEADFAETTARADTFLKELGVTAAHAGGQP